MIDRENLRKQFGKRLKNSLVLRNKSESFLFHYHDYNVNVFFFHFYLGLLVITSMGSPFLYLMIYDTHHNINQNTED